LLFVLLVLPGAEEAMLIGSAVGQLFDLFVLMIAVITALGARRWWHTCVGGVLASLAAALRPHSAYFAPEPTWLRLISISAAFLSVAFVTGLVAVIKAAVRRSGRR
jgi:hypothetical protein